MAKQNNGTSPVIKKEHKDDKIMDVRQFLEGRKNLPYVISGMFRNLYGKKGFKTVLEWEELLQKQLKKKIN